MEAATFQSHILCGYVPPFMEHSNPLYLVQLNGDHRALSHHFGITEYIINFPPPSPSTVVKSMMAKMSVLTDILLQAQLL